MKITLTIEVDNDNVVVSPNKNIVNPETITAPVEVKVNEHLNMEEPSQEDIDKIGSSGAIGETLPKGRGASDPRPRTEEYPFNVADAKREMNRAGVNISALAHAMGEFPVTRLRNIFRYDTRRFTKEEYNVILKAIDIVEKTKANNKIFEI